MIPLLLLGCSVHAQEEHSAPAVQALPQATAEVPAGPPRTVEVAPGADLSAIIRLLPAGSTLRLLPGMYAGPVHLDRRLRVEGAGAVIEGGGRGTVVFVTADDAEIRGLTIRGSGQDPTAGDAGVLVAASRVRLERLTVEKSLIGIDLRQADDGSVQDCTVLGSDPGAMSLRGDGIRLWESDGNLVEGNTLLGVRDLVVWYSEGNILRGNRVANARYGVHFMHASKNRVEGNRFEDDVVGVFVMYSDEIALVDNTVARADGAAGMGFGLKESSDIEVRGNRLLGNTTGLYFDSAPHRLDGRVTVEGNLIAHNRTGLRFHGVRPGAAFRDNSFHENAIQVAVDGNATASEALFEGNRWSDYAGYDLDGDGHGDLPYAPRHLARTLMDRNPGARFFDGTFAAGLLDFLGVAFPLWTPPALLEDRRPRLGGTL